MNALFYKGQIVTCVDSKDGVFDDGSPFPLIEGKNYTIDNPEYRKGIKKSCCGVTLFNVVGVFDQERFIPLEADRQADEEIHQALKEDLKVKNFQDN